jgi:hypothetical protein
MWQFIFPLSVWVRMGYTTLSALCSPWMEDVLKKKSHLPWNNWLKAILYIESVLWLFAKEKCRQMVSLCPSPGKEKWVFSSCTFGPCSPFLALCPLHWAQRWSSLDPSCRAVGRQMSSRLIAKHPKIYSKMRSLKSLLIHTASKSQGMQCCPSLGLGSGVPGQGQSFPKPLLLQMALPAVPGIKSRKISKMAAQTRVPSLLCPHMPHH